VIKTVLIRARAKKDLRIVPSQVLDKFTAWVQLVELTGLEEVRKIPGFHDEPLKGDRKGQRSIRLNRAYRAIYAVNKGGAVEFVSVEEVNKHDY
jgi:toxin HigB-1